MNIATPATTPKSANPALLATLWLGVQLVWGAVLGLSLQARTTELGGSSALAAYGLISGLGALVAAVTQLTAGPLSDRLRRSGDKRIRFYVIGSLCGAAALLALYDARSIPQLLAAFLALELGMNLLIGPYQAILPDAVPSARIGVAAGWIAAMQSIGNAAGAVLATVFGTRVILGIVLAAGLCATCAATTLHLSRIVLQPIPEERVKLLSTTFANLFVSRAFLYLGFYTMLGYLYFYVHSVLPTHFALNTLAVTGICILTFTLFGGVGAVAAAKPTDAYDERLIVTMGAALVVFSLAALAIARELFALPPGIIASGFGWGALLCADWAFACRLVPPRSLATSMAIWNLAVLIPQAVAPFLATAVLVATKTIHAAGAPSIALGLACVEMFVGAAWIWRVPRTAKATS
jgi:MFS family permease